MRTNIYIQSDFIEPYDKYLHDPMGTIRWKRLSRGGRNRREIFKLLEIYVKYLDSFEAKVVPHGSVKDMHHRYIRDDIDDTIVVYKDEMAHRGQGKEVININTAMAKYPNIYASVFLDNVQNCPISHRELFIGGIFYKLTYISLTDEWRSNCGYVMIVYEGYEFYDEYCFRIATQIKSPIFAFDYILYSAGVNGVEKFYLDFNEAPGIPEKVIVKDISNEHYEQCIPFSELTSYENMSKNIKKSLTNPVI